MRAGLRLRLLARSSRASRRSARARRCCRWPRSRRSESPSLRSKLGSTSPPARLGSAPRTVTLTPVGPACNRRPPRVRAPTAPPTVTVAGQAARGRRRRVYVPQPAVPSTLSPWCSQTTTKFTRTLRTRVAAGGATVPSLPESLVATMFSNFAPLSVSKEALAHVMEAYVCRPRLGTPVPARSHPGCVCSMAHAGRTTTGSKRRATSRPTPRTRTATPSSPRTLPASLNGTRALNMHGHRARA